VAEGKLLDLSNVDKWKIKPKCNEKPPPFADNTAIGTIFFKSIV